MSAADMKRMEKDLRRINPDSLLRNPHVFRGPTEQIAFRYLEKYDKCLELPKKFCHVCHRISTIWHMFKLQTVPLSERITGKRKFGDMGMMNDSNLKGMYHQSIHQVFEIHKKSNRQIVEEKKHY
jgi:hypothetical protein